MSRFLDRLGDGRPYDVITMSSNETIKQAVIAGLGIALISQHTVVEELHAGRLVTLDLPGLPIERTWFLLHRADTPLTPAAQRIRDHVAAMQGSFLPQLRPQSRLALLPAPVYAMPNPGGSMFVVTLIATPGTNALETTLVEALRNAWGGGSARWLAPGEAAEFPVPEMPANRWQVWDDLQAQRIDLVVQPAEGRRKRMLLADMDSTMIRQECIDELADEAGVGPRVADITARAMNGELDFEAALRERVGLLKGLPASVIAKVLAERITFMPGGRELVATMRAAGAYAALVSGGFTAFTAKVAAELGFDENRANTLDVANGALTGKVVEPILGRAAKVAALEEIAARLGLRHDEVMAVGDGANDLGMLKLAGAGVALHAKPSVAAECDIRINHGDLTALLFIQGYGRSDFVTA
jgi:phosphoserine phosphatase